MKLSGEGTVIRAHIPGYDTMSPSSDQRAGFWSGRRVKKGSKTIYEIGVIWLQYLSWGMWPLNAIEGLRGLAVCKRGRLSQEEAVIKRLESLQIAEGIFFDNRWYLFRYVTNPFFEDIPSSAFNSQRK